MKHAPDASGAADPAELAGWKQELLQSVWNRQRPRIESRLQTIQDALAALAAGLLEPEVRDAAVRSAHTLAGSLGIFGFSDPARRVRELELRLPGAQPHEAAELAALVRSVRDELAGR